MKDEMSKAKYYTNTDPFYLKGNSTGVLLIHGFSGSPAEMRGLGDYLNSKGYTVLGVKLAGHGEQDAGLLGKTKHKDWLMSAEEGFLRLQKECTRVFVIGISMGSLLAFELSKKYKSAGIVLISPAMLDGLFREYLIPVVRIFKPWHEMGPSTDIVNLESPYTYISYSAVPSKSIKELLGLIRHVRKGKRIDVPTLVIQGRLDNVIPKDSGTEILNLVQSDEKELVYFENSGHLPILEKEREQVWEKIGDFVGKH